MMPLAPTIAAALNVGLPARTKGLYLDGLDAIKAPGTGGNTFGTLIETIVLTEEGPGRVSTLSFTIDDPMATFAIGLAETVRYMDIARGVPLFLGFVESFDVIPGGVGRSINVTCIGIEALLDWMIVPSLTIAANTDPYDAVGMILAAASGLGWALRINGEVANSAQATPLSFGLASTYPLVVQSAITLTNSTVRQALTALGEAVQQTGAAFTHWVFTVDFYGGLRSWSPGSPYTNNRPTDWNAPTTSIHEDLTYSLRTGDATHTVYVVGGNAAGTGYVTDGSGIASQVAVISDSTILTAADRDAAGLSYIAKNGIEETGRFVLGETATANIGAVGNERHPATPSLINDTAAGLASTFTLTTFTKRFYPSDKETWTVEFGSSSAGKASSLLRRLTSTAIK